MKKLTPTEVKAIAATVCEKVEKIQKENMAYQNIEQKARERIERIIASVKHIVDTENKLRELRNEIASIIDYPRYSTISEEGAREHIIRKYWESVGARTTSLFVDDIAREITVMNIDGNTGADLIAKLVAKYTESL